VVMSKPKVSGGDLVLLSCTQTCRICSMVAIFIEPIVDFNCVYTYHRLMIILLYSYIFF
jgi:hypothetical protein